MLFERIKNDLTAARKRNETGKVSTLRVLVGELELKADFVNDEKIVNDDVVIATIKKFIQNNTEFPHDHAEMENEILSAYLPTQLTVAEIRTIVYNRVQMGENMGQIMSFFRDEYAGYYDGRTVSTI